MDSTRCNFEVSDNELIAEVEDREGMLRVLKQVGLVELHVIHGPGRGSGIGVPRCCGTVNAVL